MRNRPQRDIWGLTLLRKPAPPVASVIAFFPKLNKQKNFDDDTEEAILKSLVEQFVSALTVLEFVQIRFRTVLRAAT